MKSWRRAFIEGFRAGAGNFFYKNGSQEPRARPFLEGAGVNEKKYQLPNTDYSKCLSNPLPFYAMKIIYPFLNSNITANHGKRKKSLYLLILL